jgi:hypothetical protein
MAEGMTLAGVYFHFGTDGDTLAGMTAVMVYRTPGDTLVIRACDDPDGRLSMILSHLNSRELAVMMQCIGTPVTERQTA